jgi:hypothetical protein
MLCIWALLRRVLRLHLVVSTLTILLLAARGALAPAYAQAAHSGASVSVGGPGCEQRLHQRPDA